MVRNILLLVICLFSLLFSQPSFSQSERVQRDFTRGVQLADNGDYKRAATIFQRILKLEPQNLNTLFNLGVCYLNTSVGADSAIYYFDKAVELLPKEDLDTEFGIDVHMSLAKAYQDVLKYEKAIEVYEDLLGFLPEELSDLRAEVEREIEMSENGIELMKNPVKLEVTNLGPTVNSKYDDHSPLISADESVLFFTSRRISSFSEMMPDGQFTEKIFSATLQDNKWGKAEILKAMFDRQGHEAAVSLSADGTELYILRSGMEGQDIYVSLFDGETWSEPNKMPKGINSNYQESHVCINADKSALYFTSDRPGGLGGIDIYMVRRLPNGEWGTPFNLGSTINTQYDEETPMLHPDGETLYFSSEGHNSMGRFDIFYSKLNADSTWNKPVNMGYPLNSPDDDFFFVPTVTQNRAYMASSRFDDSYGGTDLYLVEYEEPEEERLAVVKGGITAPGDLAIGQVKLTVVEQKNNKLVGEYRPNPATGKFVMILEAEKLYDLKYEGAGFESYQQRLAITREMTYLNQQQSVTIDPVGLKLTKEVIEAQKEQRVAEVLGDDVKIYTVQILALKEAVKSYEKVFEGLDVELVKEYKCNDGYYRYSYGSYVGYRKAKKAKKQVADVTVFADSFVRFVKQYDAMIK